MDLETGEASHGPWRLPVVRMVFASPVAAAGRIYITSREGITLVFDHSQEQDLRLVAVNRLDDAFSASPALVGQQLILRGERFLYSLNAASEP